MFYVNYYKDDPALWAKFKTKEEVDDYMSRMGGSFVVKQGESFNSDWVDEEIKYRAEEEASYYFED